MTVFQKVPGIEYKPDEVWINEDPKGLWSRVAIVTFWSPAARARKAWKDQPAVIGTLRTLPGIDLFVRGLLANPQIRVVVIDGTDASADKATSKVLLKLWKDGLLDVLGDDIDSRVATEVLRDVALLTIPEWDTSGMGIEGNVKVNILDKRRDSDRPGGALVLPPPPPRANAPAPHGDPGERVVGDTLADVWPVILQRIMAFGRAVPTQYGETRELLNLVSVIREPWRSLRDIECAYRDVYPAEGKQIPFEITNGEAHAVVHPVLGLTYAQVADYARQFLDPVPPGGDGTAYAYGARLRGLSPVKEWAKPSGQKIDDWGDLTTAYRCESCGISAPTDRHGEVVGTYCGICKHGKPDADQIAAVHKLLTDTPSTRAAFVTPWRAESDSGIESGRPCLTGVTFRATPAHNDDWRCGTCGNMACGVEASAARTPYCPDHIPSDSLRDELPPTLHMTVTFRSHDAFGAYNLNIAALCLWLCEEARVLGMAVGTLTCVSQSAHVYEKGYNAAQKVIDAHKWPAVNWDQRSTWRVEVVPVECARCAQHAQWRADGYAPLVNEIVALPPHVGANPYPDRPCQGLRAVCLTPDGNKVTRVFEGRSASELAMQIERSGLVTAMGGAMWLGSELAKAEAKL